MARVGTSGWSYDHWRDVLYTRPDRAGERLQRYAAEFDTVELNGSFYRWPSAQRFAAWRDGVPEGFDMSVKGPRGLTHAKRLRDPGEWVGRIANGLESLGSRRGPLLFQLPPTLERDDELLSTFLSAVPGWMRPAIELRHPSWLADEVFGILERTGTAYCVMSGADLRCELRATAPLVYVRLHGPHPHALYSGSYSDDDMRWWADRIRDWESGGHEVYAYFNNDGHGYAVENARTLREILGGA